MHIAIMGSGQLAQMMAKAGQTLNITCSFLADNEEGANPVQGLGDIVYYDKDVSAKALYQLLGTPELITVEKEDVNLELLSELQQFCRVAPSPGAIAITQNRYREKSFLNEMGLPTVQYYYASSAEQIKSAAKNIGFPLIIKAQEQGYDGKNQWRCRSEQQLEALLKAQSLGDVVLEQWVDFTHEVSIIAARSVSGEKVFYSLTENDHKDGILVTSKAPATGDLRALETTAQSYINKILERLDYVGILSMECFVVDGEIIINELAPRVHNSGHWTQLGSTTCQFENHLRAISAMPLGETKITGRTAMLNILGKEVNFQPLLTQNAEVYSYQKSCRPGRKMGHINFQAHSKSALEQSLTTLKTHIYS